jgi:signal transduction histidine kinase
MVGVTIVFVIAGCGRSADAQLAKPEPPRTLQQVQTPQKANDQAQMRATIVQLQQAVLARDKEIATLRGVVADLQMAILESAVDRLDPDTKKALRPEQKPAPQTPPK